CWSGRTAISGSALMARWTTPAPPWLTPSAASWPPPPPRTEERDMRIGNPSGRLTIFTDEGAVDVERASGGRFGADPQAVYQRWPEFVGWAATAPLNGAAVPFPDTELGPPAPRPGQVVATGLNYPGPAPEAGFAPPQTLTLSTKPRHT